MRILDRERYWAFLKAYLICFIALVGLYVVIDAFTKLDEFTEVADGTLDLFRRMGWFYLIRLSLFYDRLCGVMTMMAAIFTVTWMQRNNELLAMLAAGLSTRRVIRPVIVSSVIVSGLAIVNQEYVIPSIGGEELMKEPDDETRRVVGVYSQIDANDIMIQGQNGNPQARSISPFVATLRPGLFDVPVEIEAKQGVYIPEEATRCPYRNGWLLRNVKIAPPDAKPLAVGRILRPLDAATLAKFPPPPTGLHSVPLDGPAYFLETSVSFAAITRSRHWFEFAPTLDLIRGLDDPTNAAERLEMSVFLHARILRPLTSLTLLFLSLPLVLGGDGRNMFINLGLSLATSGAFYAVNFIAQFLGKNAVISPELAAWVPLFAFGAIAVARWDTIRT